MANNQYIDGGPAVTGDDLNQFVQEVGNVNLLRGFVGVTLADGSPMVIFLAGTQSPGDGGQGFFWWNPNSIAPDDGSNVIVPFGATTGAWNRENLTNLNTPSFDAYLTSNTPIVSGVETRVPFNAVGFNNGGFYDTTSFRFAPSIPGNYIFALSVMFNGTSITAGQSISARLHKNGAIAKFGWTYPPTLGNQDWGTVVLTTIIAMNGAGDFVEGFAYCNGTSPIMLGGESLTYLSGALT